VDTPLLRFVAPTAHEVAGSDLHRACLTRLCCAFRLSQPLDASFPPNTLPVLFRTGGTRGVRPSEGFPSDCRDASRHPLPLLAFVVDRRALGDVARAPGGCCGGPSPTRCPRRRTSSGPRSVRIAPGGGGCSGVREDAAGVGRAFRGFSPNRKSVLRSAGVTPHDGSRSSPGIFSPPGVSPSSP